MRRSVAKQAQIELLRAQIAGIEVQRRSARELAELAGALPDGLDARASATWGTRS